MSRARAALTPLLALVRLHWIALCVIAGLVLLYTLAGFFLVPYVARTQLTKYVTETLHRQLSLGEIRFNPYTLEARIRDLRQRAAGRHHRLLIYTTRCPSSWPAERSF